VISFVIDHVCYSTQAKSDYISLKYGQTLSLLIKFPSTIGLRDARLNSTEFATHLRRVANVGLLLTGART